MRFLNSAYRSITRRIASARLEAHRRSVMRLVNGGEGLHLDAPLKLNHPDRITLGRNVHFGHNVLLNAVGGISIGDDTIFSHHITVYSYDHNFRTPQTLPFDEEVIDRPVTIGRYVWIGIGASIAPGTQIGDGAVIGMGAVVSGTIPPNAIVVNAKPRIVGYRDAEHTAQLAGDGQFFRHTA